MSPFPARIANGMALLWHARTKSWPFLFLSLNLMDWLAGWAGWLTLWFITTIRTYYSHCMDWIVCIGGCLMLPFSI
jgi:hypothetical protein